MTPFWLDDVDVLYRNDGWRDFVPSNDREREDNLNALTRFAIYVSAVVSIYKKSWTWLLIIALPVMLLTIVVQNTQKSQGLAVTMISPSTTSIQYDDEEEVLVGAIGKRSVLEAEVPRRHLFPTRDNPYANVSPKDMQIGTLVLPPKNPQDPEVRMATEYAATDGIIPDERDVWNRGQSGSLTYFTVAGAPYGDVDGEFRKWLAKDIQAPTRKEMGSNFGPVNVDMSRQPQPTPYPYLPDNPT